MPFIVLLFISQLGVLFRVGITAKLLILNSQMELSAGLVRSNEGKVSVETVLSTESFSYMIYLEFILALLAFVNLTSCI